MIIFDGYNGGVGSQYGDGRDGVITITSGSVDIQALYETSGEVLGATTKNGADQGLGYGLGTYDPENGAFIQATDFTIDLEATLTHGTAYGDGSSNKNGIVYIGCIGTFTNNGTIDVDELGGAGGAGGAILAPFTGGTGIGSGGGAGGYYLAPTYNFSRGGAAGIAYGTTLIPKTTWADLYGSGGGGGSASHTNAVDGGAGGGGGGSANAGTAGNNGSSIPTGQAIGKAGGAGGGSIRIYATKFITDSGAITANGANGVTGTADTLGGGGGGSGGTVYIETISGTIGTNLITCTEGAGGVAASGGGVGGAGSVGRIHIAGAYTGTTDDPAIA